MRSWAREFQQFLLRGNVIDLAVAFVVGAAFAAPVQAAVADLSGISVDARRCAYRTSEVAPVQTRLHRLTAVHGTAQY